MSKSISKIKTGKVSVARAMKPKQPTHFYMKVFSRHPSSADLRRSILVKGAKVVYRHGSTTEGDYEYEVNSPEAIKISADKLKMKEAFDKAEVKQAPWLPLTTFTKDKPKWDEFLKALDFNKDKDSWLIIKHRFGSRGVGNYLIKNQKELDAFMAVKDRKHENYIMEEYKRYTREYRLHVSEGGCFYTCRKMLKKGTPEGEKFQRHDDNCSWFIETHPQFDKPDNWNDIVKDCQNILKVMEADVLAFDVKCTTTKEAKDKNVRWIIIETCSAPSFGKLTMENYKKELPKIIKNKYKL